MQNKIEIIGYPRIGENRELKFALEQFWRGEISFEALESIASDLRKTHWQTQADSGVAKVSINDFSLYDNMLDLMVILGAIPERFCDIDDKNARYFAMARGDSNHLALEMTKWFNTNYHYLVPELRSDFKFSPIDISKISTELNEANKLGFETNIQLIGPLTFLALSRVDEATKVALFDKILAQYEAVLSKLTGLNITLHEPSLARGADASELSLLKIAYDRLAPLANITVATYFEHSNEATAVLVNTPIQALFLDFIHGSENIDSLDIIAKSDKKLIAGVVDGRNVWKNNLPRTLELLESIAKVVGKDRLSIAPSCSLLHTPYTIKNEAKLDKNVLNLLSFANEKLLELQELSSALFNNRALIYSEPSIARANPSVQERVAQITAESMRRDYPYNIRAEAARELFDLPPLPTTTIGSFPQTAEVRKARRDYKDGTINHSEYDKFIKKAIADSIELQEQIDIDVLVHGEFERNDMVEYFGESLDGFAFSSNGWVQSYGSRCVKPPLLYADVSRARAMTLEYTLYAKSLTQKPLKGMLTGPVTILNWSFVRDDIPRSESLQQIALAISDEIDDLQKNNIKMIQVDEAAFKEGYPLRKSKRADYEKMALESFLLSTAVAERDTQIHTHMCYSDFTDIMPTIEAMDADVISIETSRSSNRLLKIFATHGYDKEVGPGVYDIHSPRVPSIDEIKTQIDSLLEVLPASQLWINPDCGLKTRGWSETKASLINMVEAVKKVRERL